MVMYMDGRWPGKKLLSRQPVRWHCGIEVAQCILNMTLHYFIVRQRKIGAQQCFKIEIEWTLKDFKGLVFAKVYYASIFHVDCF